LGGIAAVIVVGIISALVILQDDFVIEEDVTESKEIDPSTSDLSQFEEIIIEEEFLFDFESHDLVRLYQGSDGEGAMIIDILNSRMFQNYPDLNEITSNPHRVEWYNFADEENKELVTVGFAFETFKENSEYIWQVNKTEQSITAQNEAAQEILDIVNSD